MSTVRITPEYPGLVVSADGRIQGPSRRWLKPWTLTGGYLTVGWYYAPGRKRSVKVATIVCTAFHGPRPTPGHEVAHGNGILTDNRADNLRWATRVENHADKRIHGTDNRGERHSAAKLSDSAVREIRAARGRGETVTSIGERFGVNWSTVSKIVNRKAWGHVQ